jgi:uncharacterized membrane protein
MVEEFGPVQVMVVGFGETKFEGKVLSELKRLKDLDIVRLIGLVVVEKDRDDNVTAVELSDLTDEEREEFGALAGALIGLGAAGEEGIEAGAVAGAEAAAEGLYDPEDVWVLADEIPAGMTAAIALLEHRWAIPLRDAIMDAGGMIVADEWIHPTDLVRYGLEAAAE